MPVDLASLSPEMKERLRNRLRQRLREKLETKSLGPRRTPPYETSAAELADSLDRLPTQTPQTLDQLAARSASARADLAAGSDARFTADFAAQPVVAGPGLIPGSMPADQTAALIEQHRASQARAANEHAMFEESAREAANEVGYAGKLGASLVSGFDQGTQQLDQTYGMLSGLAEIMNPKLVLPGNQEYGAGGDRFMSALDGRSAPIAQGTVDPSLSKAYEAVARQADPITRNVAQLAGGIPAMASDPISLASSVVAGPGAAAALRGLEPLFAAVKSKAGPAAAVMLKHVLGGAVGGSIEEGIDQAMRSDWSDPDTAIRDVARASGVGGLAGGVLGLGSGAAPAVSGGIDAAIRTGETRTAARHADARAALDTMRRGSPANTTSIEPPGAGAVSAPNPLASPVSNAPLQSSLSSVPRVREPGLGSAPAPPPSSEGLPSETPTVQEASGIDQASSASPQSTPDYTSMPLAELKKHAAERGIQVINPRSKQSIIKALEEAEPQSSPAWEDPDADFETSLVSKSIEELDALRTSLKAEEWSAITEALSLPPDTPRRKLRQAERDALEDVPFGPLYDRIFKRPDPDLVHEYQRAWQDVQEDSPTNLAQAIAHSLITVGDRADFRSMTPPQRLAAYKIVKAGEWAKSHGWNVADISSDAVQIAAARFPDGEDAAFVLRRFLKDDAATVPHAGPEGSEPGQVPDPARQRREAALPSADEGQGGAALGGPGEVQAPARRARRGEYSKAAIERRLIEAHQARGDVNTDFSEADSDRYGIPEVTLSTDFAGELPREVRDFLEGRGIKYRSMFRENVAGGKGSDFMESMGDEYFSRVEALGESRLTRAIETADMEPETRFLKFVHDSLPPPGKQKERGVFDIIDKPHTLDDGTRLRVGGREFEVVHDDDGLAMLVEQDVEPTEIPTGDGESFVSERDPIVFYLEAIDSIPVERGSIRAKAIEEAPIETAPAPRELSELPGVQKGLYGKASDGGITGSQAKLFDARPESTSAEPVDPDAELREKFREAEKNTPKMFDDDPDDAGDGAGDLSALASTATALPSRASPAPSRSAAAASPVVIKPSKIAPDPIKPAAGAKRKPISEIMLDVGKSFGKVRRSRIGSRFLGMYYAGSRRTVVRFAGDLDTTAHEVAHNLDDYYGIVGQWAKPTGTTRKGKPIYPPSPYDAELFQSEFQQTTKKSMKKVEKRAEAVAEWTRAWLVNPKEAERLAPAFTKFFESKVPEAARTKLREFGDDIRRFAGLPASEQVLSNVRVEHAPASAAARVAEVFRRPDGGEFKMTAGDKFRSAIDDSFHPVYKAVEFAKNIRGIDELLPSKSPRILIQNLAGFDAKFADVMEHGPINAENKRRKGLGGLKWLLEPLDHTDEASLRSDFEGVVALLNSERMVEKADLLDQKVAAVKQLRTDIQQLQKQAATQTPPDPLLIEEIADKTAELKGIMKKAGYSGREQNFPGWAAQRKERMSGFGGGVFNDESVARDAVKEIEGGDPKRVARLKEAAARYRQFADSVLQYAVDKGRMSQKAYDAIKDENKFYSAFNRVMEDQFGKPALDTGKRIGSRKDVTKRFRGSTLELDNPYVNLIDNAYRAMKETDSNAAVASFVDVLDSGRGMYQGKPPDLDQIGSQAKPGDANALKVYRDGELEHWQFQEDVHAALQNWYALKPDVVGDFAAALNSIAKLGIVYSPPYIIRNQVRDPVARAVISRHGSQPWDQFAFVAGRDGRAKFRETMSEFNRMGGGLFGNFGVGKKDYYRTLARHLETLGKEGNTIVTTPSKLVGAYKAFAQGGEAIGRAAEYRRAYQHAKSKLNYSDLDAGLYAANEARGLQDFAKAGTLIRKVNQYVLFANSMVRGIERSIRGAREKPARFAARWALYAVAPTIAEILWNQAAGTDEERTQLPAYQRDFFWNFKLGPEKWISVPKPWELGVLASGVDRAIEKGMGRKNAFDGYFSSIIKATLPDEGAIVGPMRPLVESMTNHSFFKGGSIVPDYEEKLDPSLRKGSESASRIGKLLSEYIGQDPRLVDHWIRGLAGGIGDLAIAASDVGRGDKQPGRRTLLERASGVVKAPAPDSFVDVRYVLDESARKGVQDRGDFKSLRAAIKRWRESPDAEERARLSATIRQRGSELRNAIDQVKITPATRKEK